MNKEKPDALALPTSAYVSHVQTFIGGLAVMAFLASVIVTYAMPELRARSDLLIMNQQNLNNGFWTVLGFYFGTSMGSVRKTDMLNTVKDHIKPPQTVNIDKTVIADTVVDSKGGNVDEVITNG